MIVLTGRTCPYVTCLVREPHTHPACPDCGAVRYGNIGCDTCRQLRAGNPNPHTLVGPPRVLRDVTLVGEIVLDPAYTPPWPIPPPRVVGRSGSAPPAGPDEPLPDTPR